MMKTKKSNAIVTAPCNVLGEVLASFECCVLQFTISVLNY